MIPLLWISQKLVTLTFCITHLISIILFVCKFVITIIIFWLIGSSSICSGSSNLISLKWLINYLLPHYHSWVIITFNLIVKGYPNYRWCNNILINDSQNIIKKIVVNSTCTFLVYSLFLLTLVSFYFDHFL